MAGRKVIGVKDWTCGMSDELGRVVLTIKPTEGESIVVLMTIFQAAKMAQELRSPKFVPFIPSTTPRQRRGDADGEDEREPGGALSTIDGPHGVTDG